MKKRIVLITPGQPSVNPRIVKEANALSDAGHDVTMVYCFWTDWAQEADKKILAAAKWRYKQVGGTPGKGSLRYFINKVQFKFANFLYTRVENKWGIAEKAQVRSFKSMLATAKSIKADWYIGHNLGALAVAAKAARYNNAKAAFDFEDYHRAENEAMTNAQVSRIIYLENKYVPSLSYISTASPLISAQVKSDFPNFDKPIVTINNAFPKKEQPAFIAKHIADKSLQLFWFSQTIGTNRGIEVVLKALNELADKEIYLTLIGAYTQNIKNNFLNEAGQFHTNVHFKGMVDPDDIPVIGATMDIGLALEQSTPHNRDICLTNKIFTYLQCGNAVIATNTKAQVQFQQQYAVGSVCAIGDVDEMCGILKEYKNNNSLLYQQREKNWRLANELLNWENESKKLLALIQ